MSQPQTLSGAGPVPVSRIQSSDKLVELAGWGANVRSPCTFVEPEVPAELHRLVRSRRLVARGLGRSYGDAALNAGGLVVGMRKLDRYLEFDPGGGMLRCEAGVSLSQIIRDFGPRGFFPMISPGTQYVTVGGCIANDVHGKAHHSQGSFANCVQSMRILLASGDVVTCSRDELSDLFWASFGGMGLLGVVLNATLQLKPIETTYYKETVAKGANLEELLEALDDSDKKYPYSVSSIDVYGKGAGLGRGVLNMGDLAGLGELPPKLAANPLRIAPEARLRVPFELPELTLNRHSIRLVNAYVQRTQARKGPFTHYQDFTYPLDILHDWYRGYGPRGFTQYQFVIPFREGRRAMRRILEVIVSAGELPFLNVLKRLGKASGGLLSFPTEGYTLAIDFPVRDRTVGLTRRLDAMVLEGGGRVYLGKDSYLEAKTFRTMYPRCDEWLAVKAKYDPDCVFVSDLGRRVGLVPASAR